jgi:hypothetical protein
MQKSDRPMSEKPADKESGQLRRAVLVTLALVMAIAITLVAYRVRAVRRSDRTRQVFESRGCYVNAPCEWVDSNGLLRRLPLVFDPIYSINVRKWTTSITDEDVALLARESELRMLDLSGTLVTDAGLKSIEGLQNLDCLELGRDQITDAGMKSIGKLRRLSELLLDETRVTDAGLVDLEGLGSLKKIYLRDTTVTDLGIERLRQALPGVEIIRAGGG